MVGGSFLDEVGLVTDDAKHLVAEASGLGDGDHGEVLFEELGIGLEAVLHDSPDVLTGEHENEFAQGEASGNQGLFVGGGPSWARTRDLSLIRTAL